MEPEAMKNLELDKVCRCCLTVKKEMRPLFGESIAEMLTQCVQIQVEKTDGWPDKICMQCVQQVCRFHGFKQRLEKLDQQLRDYIKGLTVVVEEQVAVPQELALANIELPPGLATPQFLARTTTGPQLINSRSLLTATSAFPQPVQMPANTQLVHHNGQLIPIQMLSNNQAQLVQIRRAPDETCEIIVQPRTTQQIQATSTIASSPVSHAQPAVILDHQRYYEESIETPHEAAQEQDEDDEEDEEEELEEDEEEDPSYIVEEIPDSEYELEIDQQREGDEQEVEQEIEIFVEHSDAEPFHEAAEEEEEGDEEEEAQLLETQPTSEDTTATSNATSGHLVAIPCDNHVEISPSDSDEDAEQKFISQQTSCPAPGRYICNLCHREFKYSKWLHGHMKYHSNWIKANYKKHPECQICHKKFKGPGMLKMHMKSHEERMLKCDLCLRPFQNEFHLNRHIAKHNKVDSTAYKCVPCDRTFISANDLRIHRRTHSKMESPTKERKDEEDEPLWKFVKRQKV